MTEVTETQVLVRQEHLPKLEPFCRSLVEVFKRSGLGAEESLAAFRQSVAAECVQCGTRVAGEQLCALLAQPLPADKSNPRLERLHHGYCAAEGCNSYYYRLAFRPDSKLDWPSLLKQAEVLLDESAPNHSAATESEWAQKLASYLIDTGLAIRLGIGMAVVVFLLIVRQWQLGGPIPIIRQPEHFRVTLATNVVQEVNEQAFDQ
jgi:hypothetical protein